MGVRPSGYAGAAPCAGTGMPARTPKFESVLVVSWGWLGRSRLARTRQHGAGELDRAGGGAGAEDRDIPVAEIPVSVRHADGHRDARGGVTNDRARWRCAGSRHSAGLCRGGSKSCVHHVDGRASCQLPSGYVLYDETSARPRWPRQKAELASSLGWLGLPRTALDGKPEKHCPRFGTGVQRPHLDQHSGPALDATTQSWPRILRETVQRPPPPSSPRGSRAEAGILAATSLTTAHSSSTVLRVGG
jgi:hypothetical protein